MVFSAIAGLIGIGLLVVLMFKIAIFALPLFIGVTAGRLAFDTGAGLPGALAVGALAGLAAFAGARTLLGRTRNPPFRTALALAFAAPSAFAGYYLVLGFAELGRAQGPWQAIFAWAGAVLIGAAAVVRLIGPFAPQPTLIGAPARPRLERRKTSASDGPGEDQPRGRPALLNRREAAMAGSVATGAEQARGGGARTADHVSAGGVGPGRTGLDRRSCDEVLIHNGDRQRCAVSVVGEQAVRGVLSLVFRKAILPFVRWHGSLREPELAGLD